MSQRFYLNELNHKYAVTTYLNSSTQERNNFRRQLLIEIRKLVSMNIFLAMTPDQALVTGLKRESATAQAIAVLVEKSKNGSSYEYLLFRDTIRVLQMHLIIEMFGEKSLFYQLDEGVVAIDADYVQIIFGKKMDTFSIRWFKEFDN